MPPGGGIHGAGALAALEFGQGAVFDAGADDELSAKGSTGAVCIGVALEGAEAVGTAVDTTNARVALDDIFDNTGGADVFTGRVTGGFDDVTFGERAGRTKVLFCTTKESHHEQDQKAQAKPEAS